MELFIQKLLALFKEKKTMRYLANINLRGSNVTEDVFQSDFPIVWTRFDVGILRGVSAGAFAGKVTKIRSAAINNAAFPSYIKGQKLDADTYQIEQYNSSGVLTDGVIYTLGGITVEIETA